MTGLVSLTDGGPSVTRMMVVHLKEYVWDFLVNSLAYHIYPVW